MMLNEENTVPTEALPVAQFKAHLRLGTGFAEDALQDEVLASFMRAALAAVEARTGKILITRAFSWSVTGWRDDRGQALPVAPVREITSVTYVKPSGEENALASNFYRLKEDGQRPRLVPVAGILPAVPTGGAVRVAFRAGFGADWESLPAYLAQAVMLLAAHYYEHRHEMSVAGNVMPFGVSSLIEPYRTVRLFAAGRAS